jgi:hypothetical protein
MLREEDCVETNVQVIVNEEGEEGIDIEDQENEGIDAEGIDAEGIDDKGG